MLSNLTIGDLIIKSTIDLNIPAPFSVNPFSTIGRSAVVIADVCHIFVSDVVPQYMEGCIQIIKRHIAPVDDNRLMQQFPSNPHRAVRRLPQPLLKLQQE